MWITIILVFCGIYMVYVWKCRRYVLPNNRLAVYPGRLPILGHAHKMFNVGELYEITKQLARFSHKNGGQTVFYIGEYPIYVISDPQDISKVLQKCLNKMFIYKLIEPLLGKMLVAAEVPLWKRSRRIIDLAFKQNLLDDYLDVFITEADRLVQALATDVGKGEVDISEKVTRSFLETTCRTTLGTKVDGKELVNDKYAEAVDTFMGIIVMRLFRPWYLLEPIFNLSSHKKKLDEALPTFFGLTKEMVQIRKDEHLQQLKNKQYLSHQYNGDRFRSFLDVLVENSVTETKSTFTDPEMRNLADNVLLAAFDTTISEMILVLVCIGSHPEVQDKMYKEILDILGDDETVSKENLNKLVYLEAVIKEAIRIYPIGPVIARQASSSVELENFTLPAGSSVMIHIWGANMNPKYWGSDAEEFKPERWFSSTLPEHPAAFASFSPGKRGCPGKIYTLMYFKTTLVALIRKYKFTADRFNLKIDLNVMLKPKSGHHITIENR